MKISNDANELSLVQGGPLYQLLRRTRLLRPPVDFLIRRIVVICLLAWLPLLLLTIYSGHAIGGTGIPFLFDPGAHARLLLCIPLFLMADIVVDRRLRSTPRQFLDRGLIAPEDQPRFENIIVSARRLQGRALVELMLLLLALSGNQVSRQRYLPIDVPSWFASPSEGKPHYTAAGYWYVFFSMTIFRFLLLRWYFRLFIWYRLLWQIAQQIRLRLSALHPDCAGGLGFLTDSAYAFSPFLVAQTVALAGILGGKIWHAGARLPQFKLEIFFWILFLMVLVFAPLCFFLKQLIDARRAGLREYGVFASRYVIDFRRKWIEAKPGGDETALGSADIQSLADLSGSYEVVRAMGLTPIGKVVLLRLGLLVAMPLAPLLLTMIPLEELLDRAIGIFF